MSTRTQLHQFIDSILDDDPREALLAYRRVTEEELPWLEQRVVLLARREKWSWAKLARFLGRTRQSVHAQFGKPKLMLRSDPYVDYTRQVRAFAEATRRAPPPDEEVVAW